MSEWSNEHDWKSCIRHKRIGGSNPPLSATQKAHQLRCAFCVLLRRDLNRERANLFACSPLGEKIVQRLYSNGYNLIYFYYKGVAGIIVPTQRINYKNHIKTYLDIIQ